MKKLLITGTQGMLGSNMSEALKGKYEIFGIDILRAKTEDTKNFTLDLRNKKDAKKAIDSIKPDFVVHCAALTNVDECERDKKKAHASNVEATENLACALRSDTRFIYISTDSVFDGKKGSYAESDEPMPLNSYAKSKLEAEKIVKKHLKNYVIIRTCIFGKNLTKEGGTFAEWIYKNLKAGKSICMFTDVVFSPVSVNTLSMFIDRLLRTNYTGTINIGSDNPISKYDFGIYFAEIMGFNKELIKPVNIDTFGFDAPRPKNTSLSVEKARNVFGSLPSVENEITAFCGRVKA